jgi:orotate phosphoribosyltransferase
MKVYQYLDNIARDIASYALEIGAIKLRPDEPFLWASGYRMPIYNDNRLHLSNPESRTAIVEGFSTLLKVHDLYHEGDIIAGTMSAGIAPGAILAHIINAPFIYIRDKPKNHGMKNQIEGIPDDQDLDGLTVHLVEDLVSTGGSSVKAVNTIRKANGTCNICISIFSYDLDEAKEMFAGNKSYDNNENKLSKSCNLLTLLTYQKLLEVALDKKYLTSEQFQMLEEWRSDPFNWGEKHGFPKVEK